MSETKYVWWMAGAAVALLLIGLLSSCTFYVNDPLGHEFADCHVGAFEPSFCVVNKTKDQAVVSGTGAIGTFNTSGSVAGEGVAIGTLLAK